MKPQFTIRFAGKGVTPSSFSVEDLQDLLREVQFALREFGGDSSTVSLVKITSKSAAYDFLSNNADASAAGLKGIVESLSGSRDGKSAKQARVLSFFERVNREKKCKTVLYGAQKNRVLEFKRKADAPMPDALMKEYKTIVGRVVSAGGTRSPQAEIITHDGNKVTVHGSTLMIQRIGQRLYQDVRVEGPAETNRATGETKLTSINNVFDFERQGVADLFAEIRERFSDKMGFEDKVNPVSFQRNLRE